MNISEESGVGLKAFERALYGMSDAKYDIR